MKKAKTFSPKPAPGKAGRTRKAIGQSPSAKTLKKSSQKKYLLNLFIAGATPRSTAAVLNIRKICEEHLRGRYQLQVIDIYQQPARAKGEEIIAVPTLIKHFPLPLRRFVGDLTNTERLLIAFELGH